MYVLGLMSGTSADGVDAALVHFSGNPNRPKWKLVNSISHEYPSDLRAAILDCGQGSALNSQEWLELAEAITEFHAHAALACDPKGDALIVGCHGQTVFHKPPKTGIRGASLQILQGPLLATLLNKLVVYDFRAKDLALGGQGAPLAPLLDAALIGRCLGWRAILNLGGIANISLIPPKVGSEKNSSVLGWDCGPANSLIDLAVQNHSDGEYNCDQDGLFAFNGVPNFQAINRWLEEPFFQTPPPKSTGREQFGRFDLDQRLKEIQPIAFNDLVSTLTVFSACVIAQDLDNLYQSKLIKPLELLIAGGGAKNPALFQEIVVRCRGIRVASITEIGLPSQYREAVSFALLAWWHILNKPGSSKAITGVSRPVILGTKATPY